MLFSFIHKAIFKLIPKEEQAQLPEDENTPEKRANKLWGYFNKADNGEYNLHRCICDVKEALPLL